MMKLVTEAVLEALLDSLKLLPFLFLTYLLMEFLEHKAGDRLNAKVTAACLLYTSPSPTRRS